MKRSIFLLLLCSLHTQTKSKPETKNKKPNANAEKTSRRAKARVNLTNSTTNKQISKEINITNEHDNLIDSKAEKIKEQKITKNQQDTLSLLNNAFQKGDASRAFETINTIHHSEASEKNANFSLNQ